MISPPTVETIQSLIKLYKNSQEWYTKETAIDTLSSILKSKTPNLDSALHEINKLIYKGVADKVKDLRLSAYRALVHLVQGINLLNELKKTEFQNLVSTCIKGFSENDERIRST